MKHPKEWWVERNRLKKWGDGGLIGGLYDGRSLWFIYR